MKTSLHIRFNLIIKAVWSPFLGEEGNRHDLTKSVDHQSAAAHSVNDRRIMNHFDFYTLLDAPQVQIGMGCCAEGISHDQKGDTLCFGLLDHVVASTFDELTVCDNNVLTIVL